MLTLMFRSDILDQPSVKLGTAIPEKAESGAVALDPVEIERRDQNAGFVSAELGDQVAALVGDEAMAVEMLAMLGADPVGRHHRHDIRDGMTHHRPAPQPRGVEICS